MSTQLQIGSDIFTIPTQGGSAPWGEEVTAFLTAVADALATVQGPNDILTQQAALVNGQASFVDVSGLVFNTGQVQGIDVSFLITRIYDSGTTTVTSQGNIIGSYNGTDFSISTEDDGNVHGITFDITNAGQVQYKSSTLANHVSSTITFSAKTKDTP